MTMITTATTSSPTFICSFHSPNHLSTKSSLYQHSQWHILKPIHNPFSSTNSLFYAKPLVSNSRTHLCFAGRRRPTVSVTPSSLKENDGNLRRVLQIGLWVAEVVYVLWLFLLPYAPGDPLWAMSSDTVNSLVDLSLNFFFILPFVNVAFLIPYMAIRLNDADDASVPIKRSNFGSVMTNGALLVGLIGGGVCLVSVLWALFGRMDSNFGGVVDRWEYLVGYLGSERLAYAFIWDICLYMIFQPWLIGDNLQNVQPNKVTVVKYLRYVPVVGLIAYLLCLEPKEE
ncbi:uncharacterized protein [Cicer arietinum]|uniref:uncharacterized protein isoform X2 n=1 Tax=Cicer arietinum TaxID=3827 RepID=UPI003CC5088F